MSKLTDTLIAFGAIPKEVLISMKTQGLITEDQVLLHGSAPHPHDLDALVWEIENALREDHLPELLELEGERGWVKPVGSDTRVPAWKTEGRLWFEYLGDIPDGVIWISEIEDTFAALSLRDVSLVRLDKKVLVQAMIGME